MSRKLKEQKIPIEGYIDNERHVFVVTKDDGGILTPAPKERTVKEFQDVRELLSKYRPKFN